MHPDKVHDLERQFRLLPDGDPSAGRSPAVLHHADLGVQAVLPVLAGPLIDLLLKSPHDLLAERIRLFPFSEALLRFREPQNAVDALRQSHKAEHTDHMIPVLFDQALVVQESILIIAAVVHDKLAPAVDRVADRRHRVGNHPVQKIFRALCQFRQLIHVEPHQRQPAAPDGQHIITAHHRIVSHIPPVQRIVGKTGFRRRHRRLKRRHQIIVRRILSVQQCHIRAWPLHLGGQF